MNSLQFGHKSQLPAALATNHLLGCTGDGEQGLSAVPRENSGPDRRKEELWQSKPSSP